MKPPKKYNANPFLPVIVSLPPKREPSVIVTWLMKNFDVMCPKNCDTFGTIVSPDFEVAHVDGSSSVWHMSVGAENKYLSFAAILKSCNTRDFENSGVFCSFKLWVGPSAGPYICIGGDDDKIYTSTKKSWGWKELTPLAHVHQTKQQCWPNGVLRLHFQLYIDEKSPARPSSSVVLESDALTTLLADPTRSDVTIKCGSESFHAHKMILARSSPVFREIFVTKKEHFPTIVEADDVDVLDLKVVLHYMYTSTVQGVDPDSWLAIIKAAEKYGVKPLKDFCFKKVLDCIRKDTVGALAVAAHLYNTDKFTADRMKEYAASNYYSLMKDSNFKMLVSQYPEAFF